MTVLRFPRHRRWNCEEVHDDGGYSCGFCSGGLFACAECGGAEGSLTTDCPGERFDAETERRILAGELDWTVRDGWVVIPPRDRGLTATFHWSQPQPHQSEVSFLRGALEGAYDEIIEAMREVISLVVAGVAEDEDSGR